MPDYDYKSQKTVVLLSSKIDPAVALNVVGHLCFALGAVGPEDLMGQRVIVDASGVRHSGISRYPIIILKTRPVKLRNAIGEARSASKLLVADYPSEMLATGHDVELVAAIGTKHERELEYFGVAATGPADEIQRIFGDFSLWRLN